MKERLIRTCPPVALRALFVLSLLIATGPARATTAEPNSAVDSAAALAILRAGYVGLPDLQPLPGEALADLERRSQGRISVLPVEAPTAATPVTFTLLPGNTIYWRMASFTAPGGWPALAGQCKSWSAQGAQGLVLDLRTTATPNDFAGAAQAAGLFLPAGTPLFTIRDAHAAARVYACANPLPGAGLAPFSGPIAVLINPRTSGAAEALATALQAHGALTLGRWSSGNGAVFADHPLTSGRVLHYLSGEVTMADGTPLWRHPVSPDIGLLVDAKKEEIVLGLIAQNKVLSVLVGSPGSHRLSEAALVRGEDPAIEAYLVPSAQSDAARVPEDSVLAAALDGLKAIRISQEVPAAPGAEATRVTPTVR